MKKLLSVFTVIAIILSVFAAPANAVSTKGSITITNATIGETYDVYKIFDAEVRLDEDDKATAVTYKLDPTNEKNLDLFEALFGSVDSPKSDYFEYNPTTHEIRKISSVNDTDIINYLTGLVSEFDQNAVRTEEAKNKRIVFDNLDFGYYLITSTLGTVVTINSTTPNVEVIDKNQEPGDGFNKFVKVGERQKTDDEGNPLFDDEGNPVMEEIWDIKNSASIGDEVAFKVSFEATNYDGSDKIQYYQVHDEKGSALWVEFDSIRVFVDGKELNRGYYLCYGDRSTLDPNNEWKGFGDWDGEEPTMDKAQWYLVHLGYDQFRITIPWLEGHHITETPTEKGNTYSLSYPNGVEDAEFIYDSPSEVVVTYSAGVEYNATIGGGVNGNLYNKSWATWTHGKDIGRTPPKTTETEVFGIGLVKKDAKDNTHLAGAEFELYKDKDCTQPVYVIPTGVDGVYILDSKDTYAGNMSGVNKQTTRKLYEQYLEEYLGADYEEKGTQKNLVVSQINGKLIVLGLAKGDYYLKEVKPPLGYNSLKDPYQITIGDNTSGMFTIFADENGNVADVTEHGNGFEEISYMLTDGVVDNSKGATLPTTGAEGIVKLVTIGSFITIVCAVLLITHKKMSIYAD